MYAMTLDCDLCFVLGFPRSGTTAMYHYLKQHPDIRVTRPKEPNIFSSHKGTFVRDESPPNYSYYKQYSNSNSTIIDFSAHTFHCPLAPKRIHEKFPDSKFCIVVRDPIDRIESHWKMIEKIGSSPDRGWSNFELAWKNINFRESASYFEPMKRWLSEFEKDRFIIMKFESLVKDFQEFNSNVASHFGCAQFDYTKIDPHMENRSSHLWNGWKKTTTKILSKLLSIQ